MKRPFFTSLLLGTLFLYVSLNMLAAYQFPPLFYELVSAHPQTAAIRFLGTIRAHPAFPSQHALFTDIYGAEFEALVYAKEYVRDSSIAHFETLLKKNVKSRDILIKLALLEVERGNENKAQEYYIQAKKVDPWLSIDTLEEPTDEPRVLHPVLR